MRTKQSLDKGAHVLLVDDEADILASLETLLAMMISDLTVHTARSGPAALELLRSRTFDLIITDYKMPGMTGLDFLAHVRLQNPNVPAILITAFPDLEIAVRAINEARVQSFLQKPVDPQQVLRVVGGILSAFGQRPIETTGIRPVESQRLQRLG